MPTRWTSEVAPEQSDFKTVSTGNPQMLSICVSTEIALHNVDLVVCVWRLLLVSVDWLHFICKEEVNIPLSNFWHVPCGRCWNLIKSGGYFLQIFSVKCVCVCDCGLGVPIGPGGMRAYAWVLAYMMHSFSERKPHGPRALYQPLNGSLCKTDRFCLILQLTTQNIHYTAFYCLLSQQSENVSM